MGKIPTNKIVLWDSSAFLGYIALVQNPRLEAFEQTVKWRQLTEGRTKPGEISIHRIEWQWDWSHRLRLHWESPNRPRSLFRVPQRQNRPGGLQSCGPWHYCWWYWAMWLPEKRTPATPKRGRLSVVGCKSWFCDLRGKNRSTRAVWCNFEIMSGGKVFGRGDVLRLEMKQTRVLVSADGNLFVATRN